MPNKLKITEYEVQIKTTRYNLTFENLIQQRLLNSVLKISKARKDKAVAHAAPAAPYIGTSKKLHPTLTDKAISMDIIDHALLRAMPRPIPVVSLKLYSNG